MTQVNPNVAHRGGLATELERLYPDPALFEELGGRDAIETIVDVLYDGIESDPALKPKFTNELHLERRRQKWFFEEWFGGEPLYSQHEANRGLRTIHGHIHISPKDAARWLGHFEKGLAAAKVPAAVRKQVFATLGPLAKALVNESHEATRYEHRCQRLKPAAHAEKLAHKGDVAELEKLFADDARLEEMGPLAMISAAGRGRLEVVERLIELGVDPNQTRLGHPTPVALARAKKRKDVLEALRARGVVEDIFTSAELGDREAVDAWLERDPTLLDAEDPARDIYRLTPLHYAILEGHVELALSLLERGATIGPLGSHMVRSAAEDEEVGLVRALLERGADATRIGPGRWVLHPELSPLLREHGADVNYATRPQSCWSWDACTGNHAQKDDPEYVQALIDHGADLHGMYGWGRAPLHFAAKAGYARVVEVLLDAGADPNLKDRRDEETPLFYAFKAGKSVDPTIVARLLLQRGADPAIENRLGRTVIQKHPKSKPTVAEFAG